VRRRFRVWCSLFVCAALPPACQTGPEVTRIANGRDASGRFISPDAYAAYLEGSMAEARGDERQAAAAYTSTIEEDPGAAEAWARLGLVLCLTARSQADRALARAKSLPGDLEDPWLAAAECDLRRGANQAAVADASRALALGPDDPEASRVLALALERSGDPSRGARIRRGLALRASGTPVPSDARPPESAIQRALASGDVTAARAVARRTHVPDADVALSALSMGRPDLASEVADLALLSDPGDSTARVAALASADLEQKDDQLARFARPLPADRTRPTARAAELMAELLSRRSGKEAARTWLEAFASLAQGEDPTKPTLPVSADPRARAPETHR
jgi:tetratricopeptide (TPR) repeat protein